MEILISAILPFIVTALTIPVTIKLAFKFGLLDDPSIRPHPAHTQTRIVPRAGGLAIYLGVVIASLILLPKDRIYLGIIIGITILLVLGLVDDKLKSFNPYLRLILLFLASLVVVFLGINVPFVTNPFAHLHIFGQLSILPVIYLNKPFFTLFLLSDVIAFFWIVTITQIINWSKGVDGQMPGIALVASLTLGLFSLKLFNQGDLSQLNIAKLAFIVSGSSFGFLIFNWYPAKIFPGFSGSTILAFMLATLSILSGAKLATAMLVLGVPSADFIYTLIRRILSGRSPVWGDRGHLHHRLLDLGWSHQKISLFYILGSAMLGVLALLIDIQSKAFVVLGVLIVILIGILWLNSFGGLSKLPDQDSG